LVIRRTQEELTNIPRTPVVVVLDNIRSALNVGAIFRTCDAILAEKLYLCGITAYPPHNKIPKTSLGATDVVPWEYDKSTVKVVKHLKEQGFNIVCTEITEESIIYTNHYFQKPTAIVVGHEIHGITKEVLDIADTVIELPMLGRAQSLNVATATGIVLYEMLRQWGN